MNEPKNEENAQNASKSWTKSDTGAKGTRTTDEDEFAEITKTANTSIVCGPTALVLKNATRGPKQGNQIAL